MIRVHAGDMLAIKVLQQMPVLATLFNQCDDGRRNGDPDQLLLGIGRENEGGLSFTLFCAQVDVILNRYEAGYFALQDTELFLEADLAKREVRRGERHVHQLKLALVVEVVERSARPGFFRIRVAFEREPVVQVLATPGIMHEDRVHAAFDGQARLASRGGVGDAVLALAGRIDVEYGRRVGIGQKFHRVFEEVALQCRAGRADKDIGMEGGDQTKLLACFVLSTVRAAESGKIGILPNEAGRRGLAARVRIGSSIEHQHLERRVTGQNAR